MTEQQNIRIHGGDDETLQVTVKDEDGNEKDLTGASLKYAIAPGRGLEPFFTLTDADGINVTDAANGVVRIDIPSSDTDGIVGTYYHELEVTDQNGVTKTVLEGQAKVIGTSI